MDPEPSIWLDAAGALGTLRLPVGRPGVSLVRSLARGHTARVSGVQLAAGIVLTVVGLGLLPVSQRLGRRMDSERDRLLENAPAINSVFVQTNRGNSAGRLPIVCVVLAAAGVVLIVTAFTAH